VLAVTAFVALECGERRDETDTVERGLAAVCVGVGR
jgi:hypothetical protein